MPGKFGKSVCSFCSLLKLFQIRVNALQRPESPEEIGGGFRADSRNAGDVIGRIADQPLEINQPSGRDAVSFPDRFLVVNLRFADAFLRRLHGDFSVYDELKSVQIAAVKTIIRKSGSFLNFSAKDPMRSSASNPGVSKTATPNFPSARAIFLTEKPVRPGLSAAGFCTARIFPCGKSSRDGQKRRR